MNKKELKAAVIRGVQRLDKKDPAWWNGGKGVSAPAIEGMIGHIDLEDLNMASTWCCVIGQRGSGGYKESLDAIGVNVRADYKFGFNTKTFRQDGSDNEGISFLTELWASVIQSRRYPRRKIASDPWVKKANRTWVRA